MKNKNALIIAYACEANKTSEPGVGWYFSNEISKFINTTVLTRENNKDNIVQNIQEDNTREFIYYDLPDLFKTFKKKIPLGTQIYYLLWQWGAYRYAKKSLDKNIDIVHHLTFGTSWISPPSFILKKKFIWGPIGGGDFIPVKFIKEMNFRSIIQESIYYTLNNINKISPFSHLVWKNASAIIFRTESSKINAPKTDIKNLQVISETATNETIEHKTKEHKKFIHALCIGRITYWKGFIYAVKGFHNYLKSGGEGKLELLGDGPELDKIKAYISENSLQDNIILNGFVDNSVVKLKLDKANVLLHPSFRDGGSWAIMEAMSYGLAVICLNTSGPKDMVTDKCGILIDIKSPKQVSEDIGNGLLKLSLEKSFFETFSKNSKDRVRTNYSWKYRGKEIKEVYSKVLNEA